MQLIFAQDTCCILLDQLKTCTYASKTIVRWSTQDKMFNMNTNYHT